jgi:hypothetical protein
LTLAAQLTARETQLQQLQDQLMEVILQILRKYPH